MSISQSVGHPYIHSGVNCDGCGKAPIKGFRYKCKRRRDHDLCGECFHRQPEHEQHGFLKIERADGCRPFQIHYIQCDACGAAPILGPRYHHKRQSDYDLCATCYVDVTSVTNPKAEPSSAFELVDQASQCANRKKHHPVFHFEVQCDECRVSPICGPRYNAVKNFKYDLCLICFDMLLVNGRISASEFRRIERPDARSAIHVFVFSCNHCGSTPICGPAYLNQMKENKVLCLMCFLSIKPGKQGVYSRVEPPRQLNLKLASDSPGALSRAQSAPLTPGIAPQRPLSAGPERQMQVSPGFQSLSQPIIMQGRGVPMQQQQARQQPRQLPMQQPMQQPMQPAAGMAMTLFQQAGGADAVAGVGADMVQGLFGLFGGGEEG